MAIRSKFGMLISGLPLLDTECTLEKELWHFWDIESLGAVNDGPSEQT